jgi:hypothetical protein
MKFLALSHDTLYPSQPPSRALFTFFKALMMGLAFVGYAGGPAKTLLFVMLPKTAGALKLCSGFLLKVYQAAASCRWRRKSVVGRQVFQWKSRVCWGCEGQSESV